MGGKKIIGVILLVGLVGLVLGGGGVYWWQIKQKSEVQAPPEESALEEKEGAGKAVGEEEIQPSEEATETGKEEPSFQELDQLESEIDQLLQELEAGEIEEPESF